jgi:hypothetical protein
MKEVATSMLLDNQRAKKDGKFPVKLRLTYRRKQKYYSTKFAFSQEEYDLVMQRRPPQKIQRYTTGDSCF